MKRTAHLEALRIADKELAAERDRRYAAEIVEREKALRIKDEADKTALGLEREIQVYKDEKANELRSQIEKERGEMATKDDLAALSERFDVSHKPVVEFMSEQKSAQASLAQFQARMVGLVGLMVSIGVTITILTR